MTGALLRCAISWWAAPPSDSRRDLVAASQASVQYIQTRADKANQEGLKLEAV